MARHGDQHVGKAEVLLLNFGPSQDLGHLGSMHQWTAHAGGPSAKLATLATVSKGGVHDDSSQER
jgi:hypothetical protein